MLSTEQDKKHQAVDAFYRLRTINEDAKPLKDELSLLTINAHDENISYT